MKNLLTSVLMLFMLTAASAQTANNFSSAVPYTGSFQFGVNPGYWGSQLTNPQLGQMAENAGVKSLRIAFPDYDVTQYGNTVFNSDLSAYASEGLTNTVTFLGGVDPSHLLDSTFPGCDHVSYIWRGLYKPIWTDSVKGLIDTANTFANYVYKTVTGPGGSIKFWEVINEPDQTGNWSDASSGKSVATSWLNVPPAPNDLINLKAPIFYYIRMLRIAYTVIKRFQPGEYICPGGIGYASTLDLLMRYTDNPVDGSVTSQFPLTGGAYFDCVSFHTYPMYHLSYWSNANGGFVAYNRQSDAMVDVDTLTVHQFDSVQLAHGYNNSTYPRKIYISTETDAPQDSLDDNQWGSLPSAINYIIKWDVVCQSLNNPLVQIDKYGLGSVAASNHSSEFNHTGLYGDITPSTTTVANAPKTQEFYGYLTMSKFLYGKKYDAAKTTAMNVPATMRGYAFNDGAGNYTYVLWTKTKTDRSEGASGSYTFPFSFSGTRYEWDYSSTNASTSATQTVALTGNPSFFVASASAANKAPVANAGVDQTITLPTSSLTLNGSGTDADGTIASYQWIKISGPTAGSITNATSASTTVTGLAAGVYKFSLTVKDNLSATGSDTMQVTVNAANVAPTANAGGDQLVSLPVTTVTLTGTGTDANGTIASYKWAKASGPTAGTITTATASTTTVTGLAAGIYKFVLTVTDNSGATGTDTTQITVNTPPVANAGANQLISLPLSSITLSGIGTDADGTIASYLWAKISGPTAGTITTTTSASTTVTGLAAGIYKFSLTVKDNLGAAGMDTVQVTVNTPPVANAGKDTSITLPSNSARLNGSGTDVDGTVASYQWSEISGPATITITSATAALASVAGMITSGKYLFALTVTDNSGATGKDTMQVTVNTPSGTNGINTPPVAKAGADQVITLPTSTVTLAGSGTDANGTVVAYSWAKISGPSSGTISNSTAASTTVTGLTAGVYKFTLTVTDNGGATGRDTMQVTVNAANIPPTANAGVDQTITLPTSTVTLSGSGKDADGTIASYLWTKFSGPTAGTITTTTAATTTVTSLAAGVYKFILTVKDNLGAAGTDTVQITVKAANIAPTANAGADQTITLPTNTVTLTGSGKDADGTIASYLWIKFSGPTAGTIMSTTAASTTVTSLAAGVYKFVLTVKDNLGAAGTDTVQVTVKAVNVAPTANAGADQTITLPTSTVTLTGSGKDADGTIAAYLWTKASGPTAGTITSTTSASTTVTGLAAGVYKFLLTVTDNSGAAGKDTMQVTVNAASTSPNKIPVANAGGHNLLTWALTTDKSVVSAGNVTGGVMLPGANFPNPGAHNSDGYKCAIASGSWPSTATNGDNIDLPLVANSGIDLTIKSLTFTVKTSGSSGSNAFGVAYQQDSTGTWIPFGTVQTANTGGSGANVTFGSLNQLLPNGHKYVIRLYVYGSGTAVTSSRNVYIKNIAVGGTSALEITLPINSVTLKGSGNDTDGTIASYLWTKASGPASGAITTPASASTGVTGLVAGTYKFVLTVTDNGGATGKDTFQVTVNSVGSRDAANAPPPTAVIDSVMDANVYPDPVQTTLFAKVVTPAATQELTIILLDISGRILYQTRTVSTGTLTDVRIDVSHFADGVYLLNIRSGGQSVTKKVVKASSRF